MIKLLEDNKIFLEKYRIHLRTKIFENIIRYEHKMEINGYEVTVIFNKYLETGELFFNDGWVITR